MLNKIRIPNDYKMNVSMTVNDAGSYGTALAITIASNGHEVVLWGHDHDPEHISILKTDCCNVAFLPGIIFPDSLHTERDLETVLIASRNIMIVVPSHVFGEVLSKIKPLMRSDSRVMLGYEGIIN